ncbi:MAG: lysylphosphatidylglycerol synthase transmembrane domain-containing protein [Spirochaetia bacterium]
MVGGVLLFQVAILVLHAFQWDLILREAGIARGLWKTFWARTSGFALTYLTPSLLFVGEPVRAGVYKTEGMSGKRLYATIALDKYIELVTKLPCITAGFALLIILARPSITLIIVCGTLLAVFFSFFIFLMAKLFTSRTFIAGFSARLARPLRRLSPRLADTVVRMVGEFATDLHAIIRRKKTFVLAMLTGIVIAVIEVFQTFYILGVLGHHSLPHSFVIYASVLIQHVISILPGNLGGMEATHLFIFTILGIGSTRSFVYTIILRIGQLTMVLLGILHILVRRIRKERARGIERLRIDA